MGGSPSDPSRLGIQPPPQFCQLLLPAGEECPRLAIRGVVVIDQGGELRGLVSQSDELGLLSFNSLTQPDRDTGNSLALVLTHWRRTSGWYRYNEFLETLANSHRALTVRRSGRSEVLAVRAARSQTLSAEMWSSLADFRRRAHRHGAGHLRSPHGVSCCGRGFTCSSIPRPQCGQCAAGWRLEPQLRAVVPNGAEQRRHGVRRMNAIYAVR